MRILVYGCGQLASGVVRSLIAAATEITVLGNERSQLERLSSFPKVSAVLIEEPIMRDYLLEAHISTADAFLALSTDDHENLLVAQIAKRMFNVGIVVCHVEEPQLQMVYTDTGMRVVSYSVGILQDVRYAITSK